MFALSVFSAAKQGRRMQAVVGAVIAAGPVFSRSADLFNISASSYLCSFNFGTVQRSLIPCLD